MMWFFPLFTDRAAARYGMLLLPDELMNQHDETLGDEFEREFFEAMLSPVDPE